MVYNPATDFVALWRNIAGNVSKVEMPGLDYVVMALSRAGLFTVAVSATAPVANQATTAWLRTAVPSYSAEGALFLWDKVSTQYLPATAGLLLQLMEAVSGQSGLSWWTCLDGPPLNTVGVDGDFAIQLDEPGGVYGPKAAGAWPTEPLPGSTDLVSSTQLDQTFGATKGQMIYRGDTAWRAKPIGEPDMFLTSVAGIPEWRFLTAVLDEIFSDAQGALIFRGVTQWGPLLPGTSGQVLASGGPGADPSWMARTTEFPSGTNMLFQQTAAPPGWTKQTALTDYALRVTSGAVTVGLGSGFSSVFSQTAVGNTTITTSTMPSHRHQVQGSLTTTTAVAAAGHSFGDTALQSTDAVGGDNPHSHSVNLQLAYIDVIIARKD